MNTLYHEATIEQNRQGKITLSQKSKMYVSTAISVFMLTGLGGLISFLGIAAFRDNAFMVLFCQVFGMGLMFSAVLKLITYYRDTQRGIHQITGTLSVNMSSTPGGYKIRSYRPSRKKYVLGVAPHTGEEKRFFEVDQYLYQTVREENPAQPYTVYFLEKANIILSMEPATP